MKAANIIKDALKNKKLIIGTRTVTRGIKNGLVDTVIFASNCPEYIKSDLNYYAKITGMKLMEFEGNSAKLGETCGKPFNILVVGIKR